MADDSLNRLKRLASAASASGSPQRDSTGIYVKVAMSVLTLILPIGAILGFQSLGSLTAKIETLTSDVRQIDQLDSIKERLIRLEQGGQIISHLQLSATQSLYPTARGSFLKMDTVDSQDGDAMEFDPRRDPTAIRMAKDGTVFLVVVPQYRRAEGFNGEACLLVWLSIGGEDLANSSIKSCLGEGDPWRDTNTATLQAVLPLKKGDTIQVKMRSDPNKSIGAVAITPHVVDDLPRPPLVPAAIISAIALGA